MNPHCPPVLRRAAAFAVLAALTLLPSVVSAQTRYLSRNVALSFYSSTPLEDISARTDSGYASIDSAGAVYFRVDIASFRFPEPLMQKHFNDKFMETARYPTAVFHGRIPDGVLPDSAGVFPVTVTGDLTVHGVTRACRVDGILEWKDGQLAATASFPLRLADYGIRIPRLLLLNIAEVVEVQVSALYLPLPADTAAGP